MPDQGFERHAHAALALLLVVGLGLLARALSSAAISGCLQTPHGPGPQVQSPCRFSSLGVQPWTGVCHRTTPATRDRCMSCKLRVPFLGHRCYLRVCLDAASAPTSPLLAIRLHRAVICACRFTVDVLLQQQHA